MMESVHGSVKTGKGNIEEENRTTRKVTHRGPNANHGLVLNAQNLHMILVETDTVDRENVTVCDEMQKVNEE